MGAFEGQAKKGGLAKESEALYSFRLISLQDRTFEVRTCYFELLC